MALSAFRDSGADISSISKHFLDPTLILNNLRCPVKTYGSIETDQHFIPLAYVKITYKSWSAAKHILTHEGKPDFLLGNDLAFFGSHAESKCIFDVSSHTFSK